MAKLVDINLNPDERTLRQFGIIALVGFGALAALAYYEKLLFSFGLGEARVPLAVTLAALGLLAALFSLLAPRLNRFLFVGLSLLAYPIGFVLSYLIMGALFFLIIGPVAVFFRLLGRDSMQRSYDPKASSYWSPAGPRRSKESYFHQY
jgi:hypothetical protein